jgi:hypothetical protein
LSDVVDVKPEHYDEITVDGIDSDYMDIDDIESRAAWSFRVRDL